jgi:SAM-dependent methyltransferase
MTGVDGYGPATYGDAFADVYDDWYADVSPPEATAAFVARRTRGVVVELGSGTGRLAAPLRALGVPVVGLDASEAMLRRSVLRDASLPVVVADMASQPFRSASAATVLIAFNTLFNLPTADLQVRALAGAAAVLRPGGLVVVEAFVPSTDEPAERPGAGPSTDDRVDVVRLEADRVVLRISRTDRRAGTVSGQHVELRDGAPVRLRPWHLRFTDPDGLDRLARTAGLALHERFADWAETPFDERSPSHVSVYRVPDRHR